MRKRAENGIMTMFALIFLLFFIVAVNYFRLAEHPPALSALSERSELRLTVGETRGTIYDCNMRPMVNVGKMYRAAAVPTAPDIESLADYALDREGFLTDLAKGEPFVFDCREDTPEIMGVTVFELPERYSESQTAHHVIGSISDGAGVSGIESSYDSVLRSDYGESSVTYQTDGFGRVLIGGEIAVIRSEAENGGVVLTIDSVIQRICESCGSEAERGAIVCSDVNTGDILAMVSFPDYSTDDVTKAMNDPNSPMIDRCLYSYSVGSAFKLVTACEALREGLGGYIYDCTGSIDINGQLFNCHQLSGHGSQEMSAAVKNSCNTYFIALSRLLDKSAFRSLAYDLGFGRETYLCADITGSAGVLPTERELDIPAELANFSFGQGKLTATPLQITRLTCAIANDGKMPVLRLIKGMSPNGSDIIGEKIPQLSQVIDSNDADVLKEMMISAIEGNPDSNARTIRTTVGAKTSTAQTGRFGSDGEELCNAWITGFFPADVPQYALTVMIEDGGYGNTAAAPIFRRIADAVTAYRGA